MVDSDTLGPVDYLVVEFPGKLNGEGFPILLDLADRGIIRILDLVFVRRNADSSVTEIVGDELEGDERLTLFRDVATALLGSEDLREVARILRPGSAAGILLYENRWAAPLLSALRRSRAELVATGRVSQEELFAAATAQTYDTEDRPWG